MGHTIATTLLPRRYCQKCSGYPRVGCLSTGRRFEHATSPLSWSEKLAYSTSFVKHSGRRFHYILTQSTIASVVHCRRNFTHPELLTSTDELKTRLIDKWERFNKSIVDAVLV